MDEGPERKDRIADGKLGCAKNCISNSIARRCQARFRVLLYKVVRDLENNKKIIKLLCLLS